MNIFAIIFIVFGLLVGFCGYKNFDWFMDHRKARMISSILGGRERARIFYIILGTLFIIFGVLVGFGVIPLS